MEIEINNLFSIPMGIVKLGLSKKEKNSLILLSEKLDYCYTGQNAFIDTSSQKSSNEFILEDNEYKSIRNKFITAVNVVKDNVFKNSTTNIDMTTSWMTKTGFRQGSDYHTHKNCWLSSCYYFGSEKFSNLEFLFNRLDSYTFEIDEYNEYNATTYHVTPSDDLFVIFPSYLMHRIMPNEHQHTRYSLACNYIPVGAYGTDDSRIKE